VRAAEGDGERVGSVAGRRRREGEQTSHHRLHLSLLGGAAAGHGELDLLRRQLGDRDAASCDRRERDSARLPQHQRRAHAATGEDALDGGEFRSMLGDDARDLAVQNARRSGTCRHAAVAASRAPRTTCPRR
jgi:hypothetical protein